MTLRLADLSPGIRAEVAATRERVARLHTELPAKQLVVWIAGNVAERVRGMELFVIKPSGCATSNSTQTPWWCARWHGTKIDDGTAAFIGYGRRGVCAAPHARGGLPIPPTPPHSRRCVAPSRAC